MAFEFVKGIRWQGETLSHEMYKTLSQRVYILNIVFDKLFRAWVCRILAFIVRY